MNEQAEEANDCPPPWAKSAKVWESLSAAPSGEIAVKNEVFAAREAEIGRLHQRIAEMDACVQAAMGRETVLRKQLAALYNSTSWRIVAPLRLAKYLMTRFLTSHNRLPPRSGDLVSSQKTVLLATDRLNLKAEPDNVQQLYLRLVRTRERISGNR